MGHAHLSPSAAERWLRCAAAPNREAQFPDKDSDASKRGTNLHACLEAKVLAWDVKAMPAVLPHPEAPLDDAGLIGVAQCFNYIVRRKAEIGKQCAVRAEEKSDPAPFTGRDDGYGTADVTLVGKEVLEVIDYKGGGRHVPETTPQLKIYGLGRLADYMNPKTGNIPFKVVRLTVFQPARPGGDGVIERYIEMPVAELLDWCVQEYMPAAEATDALNAVGVPSEEACYFCKAKDGCPEYTSYLKTQLEVMFPMSNTAGQDPLLCSTPVDQLTPAQLGEVQTAGALIKARLKDVEERLKALLDDRVPGTGWKLVGTSGTRKWMGTEEETIKFLKDEMKLKQDQYLPRSLVSPPQLQKLGLPIKKWQLVEARIEKGAGGTALAPITDPRPDVKPCVDSLFENVTELPPEITTPVFAPPVFAPEPVAPTAPAMDLSFLGL